MNKLINVALVALALSSVACGSGLRDYYISKPGQAVHTPSACDKTVQGGSWSVAGNRDELGDFATKKDALACATAMFGPTRPLAERNNTERTFQAGDVKGLLPREELIAVNTGKKSR